MDDKKFNDDDLYSVEDSDDDLYSIRNEELGIRNGDKSKSLSTNHQPPTIEVTSRPKTFHSKNFVDSESQAVEDRKKSLPHEPELKFKLSHAETSGVAISAVMLVYSLAEGDKPLFFLSTALLIFLLRPLIGALFGKNNRAVQNALHSFSIVLFIGALVMLFL